LILLLISLGVFPVTCAASASHIFFRLF
jgi:hypothetical protein